MKIITAKTVNDSRMTYYWCCNKCGYVTKFKSNWDGDYPCTKCRQGDLEIIDKKEYDFIIRQQTRPDKLKRILNEK